MGAVEDLRCLDEEIDRDASAAASRYAVDSRANVYYTMLVQSSQMMLSFVQAHVLCEQFGCLSALAVWIGRVADHAAGSLMLVSYMQFVLCCLQALF